MSNLPVSSVIQTVESASLGDDHHRRSTAGQLLYLSTFCYGSQRLGGGPRGQRPPPPHFLASSLCLKKEDELNKTYSACTDSVCPMVTAPTSVTVQRIWLIQLASKSFICMICKIFLSPHNISMLTILVCLNFHTG